MAVPRTIKIQWKRLSLSLVACWIKSSVSLGKITEIFFYFLVLEVAFTATGNKEQGTLKWPCKLYTAT